MYEKNYLFQNDIGSLCSPEYGTVRYVSIPTTVYQS